MILRTTSPQASKDEADFALYLTGRLGEADSTDLARFVWETAGEDQHRYLVGRAAMCRGVDKDGPAFVANVLQLARKPKEQRQAELELAMFSQQLLGRIVEKLRRHPDDQAAAHDAWREIGQSLQAQVRKMFPSVPDYQRDGALVRFTRWEKSAGKFHIDAASIVAHCLSPDPMKEA